MGHGSSLRNILADALRFSAQLSGTGHDAVRYNGWVNRDGDTKSVKRWERHGRCPMANDRREKSVVVLQLSGGNDPLNTIVPYTDGHYYDGPR